MVTEADVKKFGFEPEIREEARATKPTFTGWPKSLTRYRLFIEAYNMSMEESYFWIIHYLEFYSGFNNKNILKITDVFSAAENSAFFGANQQRLGLQQDRVSQYLATIGKMVKELFQLVRELRVLDERLSYYKDSYDAKSKSRESAEITLKGIWVDMVEQGAKNPASVYGMSREVQFTTLPDLFFSTHPLKPEDCDEVVEKTRLQFNRKVREVLKRKLRAFLEWKVHTFDELKNRRIFTLKYLRQHYEIIRMYMAWVKPYLKNIQRLQLDTDKNSRPDLLTAFETSIIEVELLAIKPPKEDWDFGQCVNCHFLFRTRPEMSYQQEGYQRGPLHVGRMELSMRAYAWTKKQIEDYKKLRAEEDFKLLGLIDGSVRAAMESLGDELMRYLEEAGEEMAPKPKSTEKIVYSPLPFASIFGGFKDLFSFAQGSGVKKPSVKDELITASNKKTAADGARKQMWSVYHHYKKHHGMLNW